MTIKIHLIEYFIIIMHAPCEIQAGIALLQQSLNIHHNWVSKTTRKNEKYLMTLARTRPYFIILMVRKHRSALGVQMCPVNFCRDRAKNINNTEGERVLTVTAAGRVLCSEKYIFYAASSYFVGQNERRKCHNFCIFTSVESRVFRLVTVYISGLVSLHTFMNSSILSFSRLPLRLLDVPELPDAPLQQSMSRM